MESRRRLPAEWEEQDGVLMAWPHKGTDWAPMIHAARHVTIDIVKEITRFERVLMIAPEIEEVRRSLMEEGVDIGRICLCRIETNDTWARDFGPVFINEDNRVMLLDFGFNGWGLKFPADLDNQITRGLCVSGVFGGSPFEIMGFVLEGGSIESDGQGTILTTTQCLLSPNRNPHLSRDSIEAFLVRAFGAKRVLWVENGHLLGDDTDGHIDTLARLCPNDTIVYTGCDDPTDEHFESLNAMAEELKSFRTLKGEPYQLIALPWPEACYDEDGQRLPATYANFLIINKAVLVPMYGSHKDFAAIEAIRHVFTDRLIIGVHCLPLLVGRGSLHCITMQIPKGVLA